VAVSPDGESVYVTATAGKAIVHYRTGSDGHLIPAGCLSAGGANGCNDGGAALDRAYGVAVSPGGDSVYVISDDGSISHLRRAPNGDLTPAGCLSAGASKGCNEGGQALSGARSVAMSSDGADVYVVSLNGSISHFRRAANGDLTPAGCISSDSVPGCNSAGAGVLTGASGVAISPQGDSVYVASQSPGTIAHFRRAANGDLTGAGCLNSGGTNGCNDGGPALAGVFAVVVSPAGDSVYGVSPDTDSIIHFRRAANGDLTGAGCLTSGSAAGCNGVDAAALHGARGVAISPGGDSVYVASSGSGAPTGAMAFFRRELPAPGGGNPGGGNPGGAGTGALPTLGSLTVTPSAFRAAGSGPSAVAARKTGAKVTFGLTAPGSVRFTVERRATGRKVKGLCVKQTKSNAHKPKCTRYVPVSGSFVRSGMSGDNSFRFTGRIGGKRLGAGKYRLTAFPYAGKQTGPARHKSFRIKL
jgi:DNA-binding beta-propeller fold protein YncE